MPQLVPPFRSLVLAAAAVLFVGSWGRPAGAQTAAKPSTETETLPPDSQPFVPVPTSPPPVPVPSVVPSSPAPAPAQSSPPSPAPMPESRAAPSLPRVAPTPDPDATAPLDDSPPAPAPAPAAVSPAVVSVSPAGSPAETVEEIRPQPRRAFPSLPSLTGAVGLLHASTAEVGPAHQLRFGLHGEYFGANSFLIEGDSNQRFAGGFVAGYTLRRDLELFGAILNSSNRNRRFRDATVDRDPELIKTFGDFIVGGKWVVSLSPAATIGVELGLKFLAGVSDLALSPSSTSWWLGPLFTYDARRSADIPLRFHAGASYYADNSSNLRGLSGVSRNTKEVAMFAYGIAPSRLRVALAVDAPLEKVFPSAPVVPFIEYHLAYVTANGDRDFQDFTAPNCGSNDPTKMPCIDNRDMQWLTLGARADVYRGLTVALGVDVRIRSAGFPYGPPVAPYNVMFGVSYPLDLDSLTRTVVVTRTVERDGPWKTEGALHGQVRDARSGLPIGGAVVAVVGRAHAKVVTDSDGGFATPYLASGPLEVEVSAANFEPARASATVVAGQAVEVALALVPVPPVAKIHGRITDERGAGLVAALAFAGVETRAVQSDTSGSYATSLPPGSYQLKVEAPGQLPREMQVDLVAGVDKPIDIALRAFVPNADVVLSGQRINVKKPIRFVGTSAKLTPASEKLLDGVVAVLEMNSDIKRVSIIAHWDNGLAKPRGLELTQSQADTVRAYLAAKGVAEKRLAATGAGASKPLVPNLTPTNRMRNRRVEFLLE